VRPFGDLANLKGLAFAGIADPDGFFTALERAGLKLSATLSFPDHTVYGEEETAALARLYKTSGADYLITTAKDAVKIGAVSGRRIPFYTAELDITFSDQSIITKALDKFV
jgi:tetraacyldisaccharide 4'-kinase